MSLILPIVVAAVAGIVLLVSSFAEHQKGEKKTDAEKESAGIHLYAGFFQILSAVLALAACLENGRSFTLFTLMDRIPVLFRADEISRLFLAVTTIVWTAVCFYSFRYMKHEGEEKRFYGFFLLVYGVLVALDFSGNLITFYFFYELMTLTSMPLVLHSGSREAIMAALKYLFYSMAGAYCALFGIFFLYQYTDTLNFQIGGTLNAVLATQNSGILLTAIFFLLIGFGAKAGMFPLHAWLPTAHPVAPAPASAALSAIIVKCGVLAIVRTVYYIVGPVFLRGTWVQEVWILLALLTVFMGSMLAFREKVFKKRLAYSTVSQVSYILFGLALFTPQAFTGAMFQFIAHALVKCALFMTAGIFILRTGKTRVEEYKGIGKTMGVTLMAYTIASLSLIGIPPTGGFVSKWFLAQGSLDAGLGVLSYAGPVVLLVSALLTAGYLLPITMNGFFPGKTQECEEAEQAGRGRRATEKELPQEEKEPKQKEKADLMTWMVVILSAAALLIGLCPGRIWEYLERISESIL